MSWRNWNRRRPRRSDDENSDDYAYPFDFGIGSGFQDIDELINSMFKAALSPGANMPPNANTIFYGYQVNIGPDGKPHVREFGNVKPTNRGTFERGSREPFVDTILDDREGTLKVVAEMPGVQKEDIRLEATEEAVLIKATNSDRNYETSVPLNTPVEPDSASATYRNGILEVKLKLKSPQKPKGTNVKVD